MNLRRRPFLHALWAAPLAAGWAAKPAQAASAAPPHDTLSPLLRARLQHEGVGLAVARFGSPAGLELAAVGPRGPDRTPLTISDRFEIGSITKVFTGLLLADAVQRGELKLDGAVDELLPFPLRDHRQQPLRFVDLATHRSGLPRLPLNLAPRKPADPYADYGEAALLEGLQLFQPTRTRDERFEYSNLGVGLLAWLLARRARMPLAALLEERVLAPLGLAGPEGISLPGPAAAAKPPVQGHDANGQPVPPWHFDDTLAGAGALRASAAQLARFGQAALGGMEHPLSAAFALALQNHSPLGPQPGVAMGLGWMLMERDGRQIATHDGATGGFSSSLWLDRSGGRGGLALANVQVVVSDLASHLMDSRRPLRDVAAEQRARAQPVVPTDPAELTQVAGVYAASPQFKLTLREREGRLFAQATGQSEFELFASAPRRFFARVTALEISFEGPAGAPPQVLVLQQGGRRSEFRREAAEPITDALLLEPAALAPLTGVYALHPGFKLSVRASGARLFAQASGQSEFELFAKGPREFFARVTPLDIRFEGERGAVAALVLHQGGQALRFVKEER